jgi:hypothetical protein
MASVKPASANHRIKRASMIGNADNKPVRVAGESDAVTDVDCGSVTTFDDGWPATVRGTDIERGARDATGVSAGALGAETPPESGA